jgi:2,3-dihydroxybenzoate-AMP ligase
MLPGVVGFPAEFATRYRAAGYWRDQPLRDFFKEFCVRHAESIAVVDGAQSVSYAELDRRATQLALNLLDLGIAPLDRLVVLLPNCIEFVLLYFALQKIGAIPVLALPGHRYLEISQFVQIAAAVGCVTPDRHRDFDYQEMVQRIAAQKSGLKFKLVRGQAAAGFMSLQALLQRNSSRDPRELDAIRIEPTDPAVFLLSGGTTGVPKLIPRTHNDYACNSRLAAAVCGIAASSVLLDVLPISHNLPLACPGLQGFLLSGAKVVLHDGTAAEEIFALVQRHGVTHIHVVPALLIRWINDPNIGRYDLSSLRVIQSGGQRLQPQIRIKTETLIPSVTVQENFGMAEGVLMFVRLDDPVDVRRETVGRPVCPDDEILLLDDDGNQVPDGEVGEFCCRGPYTLRGYLGAEEHNRRVFTPEGFYRSGDLMRRHPSGNYMVEGRKKDLINRGGEKISAEEIENLILSHPAVHNVACVPVPDPVLGERMCACIVIRKDMTLSFVELLEFLRTKEMAKNKLPEYFLQLEQFPLSNFGKVAKNKLSELAAESAVRA